MTTRSAILIVVGCTLGLAALGTGIGYLLGQFVPGYYRAVFRNGNEPHFDPLSVGVGQGLTQGASGGVVVGIVLVVIFALQANRQSAGSGQPQETRSPSPTSWVLIVAGSSLLLILLTTAGFVVGLLSGERGAYHRRYLEERGDLAAVLESDPAFGKVEIHEYSGGGARLSGNVDTDEALTTLRSRVELAIGTGRSRAAMSGIGVK